MSDFLTSFKNYLGYKKRSESTKRSYLKDLRQFKKLIQKDLVNVDYEDIEDFKRFLKLNDYTNDSITRKLNSLNSFYKWLKNKGEINQNPVLKIDYPKSAPRKQRILEDNEISQLTAEARKDMKMYAIFCTLLYTGMKISELANLKVKDVDLDFQDPTISIENDRIIPITDKLLFILNTYMKDFHEYADQKNINLFYTSSKKPILVRNLRTMLDKLFKKVDTYDVKVNDLRSTFIVKQLEAGCSVEFVGKLVGHKSLKATERYLRYVEDYEDKKIKKIMDI